MRRRDGIPALDLVRKIDPGLGDPEQEELAVGVVAVSGHFEAIRGMEPVACSVLRTYTFPRHAIPRDVI